MPNSDSRLKNSLGIFVDYPKTVLIVFTLITAFLGWHVKDFEIDASADTLLMKDDPHYLETQKVNRRFSPQEYMLIVYEPKRHPLLSPQSFQDIEGISEKLQRLPRVQSVRSILNVPLFWLMRGGLSAPLDPASLTIQHRHYDIQDIKDALGGDPLYEALLINKAQTATAIQILFKSDPRLEAQEKTLAETRKSEISTIRTIIHGYEKNANLYIGGIHVLAQQLIDIIKNDLIVFGSAIALMICIVLFFLFRKLRWVFIPVICCASSLLSTLGLFGWLHLKATVISSSFVALQLILTLAIVIHLIVQYRETARMNPDLAQSSWVKETLFQKAGPCFYAGIINIVGFASLLFSGIRPVIDFGWMMSIAMFFAIGVSLILFPALLSLFGKETKVKQHRMPYRIMGFFTRLSLHCPRYISLVCVALAMASAAGLFRLDVENSFLNYFRDRTQVHRELSFIDQQLGGTTPLDLIYTLSPSRQKDDVVLSADSVTILQKIQHALLQHAGVGKVLSIVNFTQIAKEINDNKPVTEYELTAIYRTMEKSLRDGLLGSFFSPQHQQVRFSIRIQDTTPGLRRSELLAGIRHDMRQLGITPKQYKLTNLFVLYEDILQRLYQSQIKTIGVAFAVLSFTFFLVFRDVKLALIGIAPNLLSTMMVMGLMGWCGVPLDLMTIMIASIAMGISVDDTIHYIHRYLEELATHSTNEALERTNTSVAFAMLFTTLIVVLGFSLLAFSDFIPSVMFGLLTGLSMSLALLLDFTLLPVLLRGFVRENHGR